MKPQHEYGGDGTDQKASSSSSSVLIKRELDVCVARNASLTKENEDLRKEVGRLRSQLVSSLKASHGNERKSLLWKKIQKSIDCDHANGITVLQLQKPPAAAADLANKVHQLEAINNPDDDDDVELVGLIPADNRVPKRPPPKLATASHSLKMPPSPSPPPPPPPPVAPAPPPPPPPLKSLPAAAAAGRRAVVRRVPQVVDLYRSLTTRKDHHMQSAVDNNNKSNNQGGGGGVDPATFNRNMIGEIENRSIYLSAIKSEVERQGRFINFLIKEVESARFREMSDVEIFVKWLDDELSSLVDERAVLKHFPHWPERKADAMREAAFCYRDLKNLQLQTASFRDNPKDPLTLALKRIQPLQDRLERSINNVERTRESTCKKYRDLQIPWEWMLETGLIGHIKLTSLRLAKEYMKRVVRELSTSNSSAECWVDQDNLLLKGVRFAFRVHQFVGGFDEEAIRVFDELKNAARQGKQ